MSFGKKLNFNFKIFEKIEYDHLAFVKQLLKFMNSIKLKIRTKQSVKCSKNKINKMDM